MFLKAKTIYLEIWKTDHNLVSSPPRQDQRYGPTSLLSNGCRGFFRPVREADHSPPSSAEVQNTWNYTTTPTHVFMAWCLFKYRDDFT